MHPRPIAYIAHFIGGENDKVNEELEELDEGHDGEAEPQTQHSTRVGDVLNELKIQHSVSLTVHVLYSWLWYIMR